MQHDAEEDTRSWGDVHVQQASVAVPLEWNEMYYTNCPMMSAEEELGCAREHPKKIGAKYGFLLFLRRLCCRHSQPLRYSRNPTLNRKRKIK